MEEERTEFKRKDRNHFFVKNLLRDQTLLYVYVFSSYSKWLIFASNKQHNI